MLKNSKQINEMIWKNEGGVWKNVCYIAIII